ncbi:NAD(P)-binding protein [Pleomassaria siparia CBS 279.74]|uniref:NAD(P)-binding protein n=1 Tax=Pleomassaria siparia CBS 279.74 TaxID=1314801 RepID=A0A6G1KRI1_9PLEO|nr:NAD(P)-binding protein [Pleomassaria siparia CBS 279.74]
MELKNIAILGPRGNVGSRLITELLKDGSRFNITGITRPEATFKAPEGSNITHLAVDYTSLSSLTTVFAGQHAVVNCITGGAMQYDAIRLIIDAAIAAGVKLYFANEFVGHVESKQFQRLPEALTGAKARIRKELVKMGNAGGEMKWTSLNGGPFFDMWLMKGPAGIDIPNKRARIYGTGNNPLCWTPLPTIALAAANMLRNPAPILNRPIYICPLPGLTQSILLETVERVLGTKFTADHIDVALINKNALIALERGEDGKAMKGLVISNQFYEGDSGNDFSALVENETVGVQVVGVEEAVRQAFENWGVTDPIVESMFNVNACEI